MVELNPLQKTALANEAVKAGILERNWKFFTHKSVEWATGYMLVDLGNKKLSLLDLAKDFRAPANVIEILELAEFPGTRAVEAELRKIQGHHERKR